MAQKVQILLIDDLDNGQADETVRFALDGVTYEIDLSTQNAASLRTALEQYIGAGRRISSGPGRRPSVPRPTSRAKEVKEIRAWAQDNGYDINARGRVPENVREAYARAHQE